jgi:hypothetical protein
MVPQVFVSYSHDSSAHLDRVLALSNRLRQEGVDCRIDQYEESPAEGWPRWCEKQVEQSTFVLVACTEAYWRRFRGEEAPQIGLGGIWEGHIITQQLYNAQGRNTKFIPILFSKDDGPFVPLVLQSATRYLLFNGYDKLYRRLIGQPLVSMPALGPVQPKPAREPLLPLSSLERKEDFQTLSPVTVNPPAEQSKPIQKRGRILIASLIVIGTLAICLLSGPRFSLFAELRESWFGSADLQGQSISPSIGSVAALVARGIGTVDVGRDGTLGGSIVVIPELHYSVEHQIEIAVVLNRLYERYGMRHVGEEGIFTTEAPLNSSWFGSTLSAGGILSAKDKAVLALLGQGELSAGEALSLLYHDVQLHGLEKPVEYNADLPAYDPIPGYLLAIAEPSLNSTQLQQVRHLLQRHRAHEALMLAIGNNPFIREQLAAPQWQQDWVARMESIRDEAIRVRADIPEEDKKAFEEMLIFAKRSVVRTSTMGMNAFELSTKYPKDVVAIVVGNAHAEGMSQALGSKGKSFVLIRPASSSPAQPNSLAAALSVAASTGSLPADAFRRKTMGRSVDSIDDLGGILDGRIKPPPVLNHDWFRGKIEAYFLISLLARASLSDETTFSDELYRQLSDLHYVSLVPSTLSQIGKDRIFLLRVQVQNRTQPADLWVRTRAIAADSTLTLVEGLEKALVHLRERDYSIPRAAVVSDGVIAIFSRTKDGVRTRPFSAALPATR